MAQAIRSSDQHLLLIEGYIRDVNQILLSNTIIPSSIIGLILNYYPLYQLYGIGKNLVNSLTPSTVSIFKRYAKLNELSNVCDHPQNINITPTAIYCHSITGFIYAFSINKKTKTKSSPIPLLPTDDELIGINLISKSKFAYHTFIIKNDNELFCYGANNKGQTGIGKVSRKSKPMIGITKLKFKQNIVQISCGQTHSLLLTVDGQVYSCGDHHWGQLGQGMILDNKCVTPKIIKSFVKDKVCIANIESGADHNLCLDSHGNLWCFGRANEGQLGLQTNGITSFSVYKPTKNAFFEEHGKEIIDIECGRDHSAVICDGGQCFIFGLNRDSQIGDGGTATTVSQPFLIKDMKVIAVSCGECHTAILTQEKEVYVFGSNRQFQCNSSSKKSLLTPCKLRRDEIGLDDKQQIVNIAAGNESTMIITL